MPLLISYLSVLLMPHAAVSCCVNHVSWWWCCVHLLEVGLPPPCWRGEKQGRANDRCLRGSLVGIHKRGIRWCNPFAGSGSLTRWASLKSRPCHVTCWMTSLVCCTCVWLAGRQIRSDRSLLYMYAALSCYFRGFVAPRWKKGSNFFVFSFRSYFSHL